MRENDFKIAAEDAAGLDFGSFSTEQVMSYMQKEAEWIDSVFGEFWSPVTVKFARWQNERLAKGKAPNFIMRALIFFFARTSGLEIVRNKHMSMPGKGFRPGKVMLDHVTVTIKKRGKEVAKKDFKLSAIVS